MGFQVDREAPYALAQLLQAAQTWAVNTVQAESVVRSQTLHAAHAAQSSMEPDASKIRLPRLDHCNAMTTRLMITEVEQAPPIQLHIEAQIGVGAGIANIAIATAVSCSSALPMAAGGTQAPVPLTVTKLAHFDPARIVLAITDTNGNTANKEAIFTVLKVNTGTWAKQTFVGPLPTQGQLKLANQDPGSIPYKSGSTANYKPRSPSPPAKP